MSSAFKLSLIFSAAVLLSGAAQAQYDLSWYTVDGGGAMFTTGGTLELSGTIGQPDAGPAMIGGGYELTGGFWVVAAASPVCHGDSNCDGKVDFFDINPFVIALLQGVYCDGTGANCDITGNGVLDFFDINPFVAVLTQNPLPIPCP